MAIEICHYNMSKLVIDLQGASVEQTNRIKRILEILFDQEFFNFANGSQICNFDEKGVLRTIEWQRKKWRKEKMTVPLTLDSFEGFVVEMKV